MKKNIFVHIEGIQEPLPVVLEKIDKVIEHLEKKHVVDCSITLDVIIK